MSTLYLKKQNQPCLKIESHISGIKKRKLGTVEQFRAHVSTSFSLTDKIQSILLIAWMFLLSVTLSCRQLVADVFPKC